MITVFFRTIAVYVLLLASLRLMGKRQVGELELSELVITFLLSELAVLPIANAKAPVWNALIPIAVLLSAEVVSSYAASKSPAFRRFLLGKPSVIICKGKLDRKELDRLRMSVSELMSELRQKGVASLSEVDYAIVEDNGKLSVFRKSGEDPPSASDLGMHVGSRGIAHCVIADGKISDSGLADAGKGRDWLAEYLEKTGAAADDVCIMTVDDGGEIFIIYNEEK